MMRGKSYKNPLTRATWRVLASLRTKSEGDTVSLREIRDALRSPRTGRSSNDTVSRVVHQLVKVGALKPTKAARTGKRGRPGKLYRYNPWPEEKWWRIAREHHRKVEIAEYVVRIMRERGAPDIRDLGWGNFALEYRTEGLPPVFRQVPSWARKEAEEKIQRALTTTLRNLRYIERAAMGILGVRYLFIAGHALDQAPSELDAFFWTDPTSSEGGRMHPGRWHPAEERSRLFGGTAGPEPFDIQIWDALGIPRWWDERGMVPARPSEAKTSRGGRARRRPPRGRPVGSSAPRPTLRRPLKYSRPQERAFRIPFEA